MAAPDYDVLVVGSGFGGAVSALRLAEKGYRVGVLEAGRRFADGDFPATSWQFRDYLWAPWARCFGIFRVNPLRDVLVLSGAGVGGGSLVYANTLYRRRAGVLRRPAVARHHRLGRRARPALRPGHADARRHHVPAGLALGRGDARRRRGDGRRPHLRPRRRRGLLRRREGGRETGRGGPRPVLRRRGARAPRLPALRRVHDRVPARREEHAGQELPAPRRGGGGRGCTR